LPHLHREHAVLADLRTTNARSPDDHDGAAQGGCGADRSQRHKAVLPFGPDSW
jgi:hypothetical protein